MIGETVVVHLCVLKEREAPEPTRSTPWGSEAKRAMEPVVISTA